LTTAKARRNSVNITRIRPQNGRAVNTGALALQRSKLLSSNNNESGLSNNDPESGSDGDGYSSEDEVGYSGTRLNVP
jgi:hypothetical protein